MWPFRRKAEAAAPAAAGPQPVPAPVIRRDWLGLPPIQRLIGEHPLTAPSERFSDDLATHHDPSLSADTMGHQVSAEAPCAAAESIAANLSAGRAVAVNQRAARTAAAAAPAAGPLTPFGPGRAEQAVAREQCATNRRRIDGLLSACGGATGTARA